MDKRSDDIRQNIETTRAALDEKIDMLETKARETFDLSAQVNERPWVALGAAVAAGYVLGSMGSDHGDHRDQRWHGQPAGAVDYNQHAGAYSPQQPSGPSTVDKLKDKSGDFLSQFDDEIEMLKGAAITTMTTFLHDAIRQAIPAMGEQLDRMRSDSGSQRGAQSSGTSYSGAGERFTARSSSPSGTLSTAPNASSGYDGSGSAGSETSPEWNRYGMPAPTPTRDESEYFETYEPEGDQQRSTGERSRY